MDTTDDMMTHHPPLYYSTTARRFAMAAGCTEAVQVGRDIMRQGGNIVDAAVAAVAASCVAMPHMTGLGGDLFALLAMQGQAVTAIHASGAAPENATIQAYRRAGYTRIPTVGGLAAQTPCTPFGLEALYQRWGSLSFSALLQPAIHLAQEGILVGTRLAGSIAARHTELRDMHVWQRTFCPGGVPLATGSQLRQPNLAKALRALADFGAVGFTDSWVGQDIADSVQADGGWMTQDDLRAAYAEVVQPLSCHYQGMEVFTQSPVSQGFILMRALSLLARENPNGKALWIRATQALQQAFGERLTWLRDDALSRQTAQQLIQQGLQKPQEPSPVRSLTAHPGGHTTAMSMIDGEGNAISIIHSIYDDFGSGLMGEKSGILLNNRLSAFFLDTRYANALAPRQRSMHTLHTFIVKDQNGVRWAGGSPGADYQPQVNLHVLLHLLAAHRCPDQAVSKARWSLHPGTSPADVLDPPCIVYEPGVREEQLQALRDAGYATRALRARTIGSSKLVGRTPDGVLGAWVDTRRDGAVGAW